jgi:hypothetical protein
VICYNPEQAERDAALREVMVGKLTTLITDTDRLTPTKRAELRGRISTMPALNRSCASPRAARSASTRRRSPAK